MVAPEVQGEVSLGSQKKLGCGAPAPQQILVPHAAGPPGAAVRQSARDPAYTVSPGGLPDCL